MKFELKKLKTGRWGVCLIQKGKEDVIYASYLEKNKQGAERLLKKFNDSDYWKRTDWVSPRETENNKKKRKR